MRRFFCILLSIPLILSPNTPQALHSSPASPTPPLKRAAAYYFYWYRYPDMHFFNPDGSDAMTDHPPDAYLVPPPQYSFEDVGWHRRELLDLMEAGIEIVLPVYWGDDLNKVHSLPGLTRLVEAENQLISEGKSPPKIGMFYDTTALWLQNGNQPPDLTTNAGKQMFYGMIKDFFDRIPDHSMWARMDGKPIIYMYDSSWVSNYDQSTFDYATAHFASDFSGETPYIVREASWTGVNTAGVYGWGAAVYGPNFNGPLAAIGPGYDDSAVRNPYTFRDRECGEFYKDSWEQVLDSSATLTAVETWNEFHEATEVAATREYGRQYIELTAQYVQAWKSADVASRPYVWIDLGNYPYARGLRAANLGDGTWKTRYLAGRQGAYPDHSSTPDASYHIYLNVDDAYIRGQNNTPTPVWVTVEYFDLGNDGWFVEYDSVGPPGLPTYFKPTATVNLQNSSTWKRHTFYIPDAYFANRQQDGLADLRLVDGYDGVTNYFGRVWIFKTNPAALHAPNLTGLNDLALLAGKRVDIPLTPSDPGGGTLTLSLDRAPAFASLIDQHNGAYILRLEPTAADVSACNFRLRLLVSDDTTPALLDAVAIGVHVFQQANYLPLVAR
jgi:hypothetical protein